MSKAAADNRIRCAWVPKGNILYEQYHDTEWGIPVHDDRRHFEFLILEAAQAGLSWLTILKRRMGYKKAFSNYNPEKVASYDEKKIAELLKDEGIIRNRLKVESAIRNARHFLEIQEEFGSFDQYIWRFVEGQTIQNAWKSCKEVPAQTKESLALSKDLRKRGFTFLGPTIIYAHMQATGLVNDHTIDCFRHREVSGLLNYKARLKLFD